VNLIYNGLGMGGSIQYCDISSGDEKKRFSRQMDDIVSVVLYLSVVVSFSVPSKSFG